jgi:hypothetical protein
MKNVLLSMLFGLLSIFVSSVYGSAPLENILVGRVIDAESQSPIEYATVVLLSSDDSTQVRTDISG